MLLGKRQKVPKFYLWVFCQNSKNTIINRETVFTKIFEKTRTYRDFDETFQKCAGRLRVKQYYIFESPKKIRHRKTPS